MAKRVDIYHHSVRDNPENSETTKPCAWCKTKGTLTNSITGTKKTCDVCGGTGWNAFHGTVKACGTCGGTGSKGATLVLSNRIKCPICHGKGYNEIH
jgi:DnaJ-class molecular chaperone